MVDRSVLRARKTAIPVTQSVWTAASLFRESKP